MKAKTPKTQINPSIPNDLVKRLDELLAVYDDTQSHILAIALEYGARHFKRAYEEYHALRKDQYQDADDEPAQGDSKVVKLTAPGASGNQL